MKIVIKCGHWVGGHWKIPGRHGEMETVRGVWGYTRTGTAIRQDHSCWLLRIFGGVGRGERASRERNQRPRKEDKNTQNKFINTCMGKYSLLWCKFYSKNRKEVEFGTHSLSALLHVEHSARFRRILLDSKDLSVQYNN